MRNIICFDPLICDECFKEFKPIFMQFKIENISCLSIFYYDEFIKEKLYALKGCYDIELAPIFLHFCAKELSFYYKNYILVPIPSSTIDDEVRGFNHVVEIFKSLRLPMARIIHKIDQYKQSDQTAMNRPNIINHLFLENGDSIKGKKVLIVDDVSTTGSSLKAAISLVKSCNPKCIKCLVLSKTKEINNKNI